MKKIFALLCFLVLFSINLVAQEWQQKESIFFNKENNIFFIVDSTINSIEREEIVDKTKTYIQKDLELLQGDDLTEPLSILFFGSREEMHLKTGKRVSSFSMLKNSGNPVYSINVVYDSLHCPLNRELIKMIISTKWGDMKDSKLIWLREGLSTYATPEADDCNSYTLEDKYAYLLQNNKLIDLEEFPVNEISPDYKAARIQAAYIVSLLLEKYGIEKFKKLWLGGMDNFETIFEESLNSIIQKLNKNFEQKYKILIPIDWQTLTSDCIYPQPDDWLFIYDQNGLGKLMSKEVDSIQFIISLDIDVGKGDEIVEKTKAYIAQNLELINESGLESSMHLVLVDSREEVEKVLGGKQAGLAQFNAEEKIHSIVAVYNDLFPSALKHELMHAISIEKWGKQSPDLLWVAEGLAVFAAPEAEECTGYTLEERYVYLLQQNKLWDVNHLFTSSWTRTEYTQAGYIVKYLIEKFGIKKLKKLWQTGMKDFEEIYGLNFEEIINNINENLYQRYPNQMELDWDTFNEDCIEFFITPKQ
ncbi:hypothetical protein [Dysgonomonas sp. Marseille-P4361]|uniref:hypothetical protein n=1 Tax=Dysgonomonas sp. Marseille-P4361 TaxID=2161820 RepID=UPI000D55AFC0|nr:hypothetical protein [Dysgonomonas sp. Marseille-P4361]